MKNIYQSFIFLVLTTMVAGVNAGSCTDYVTIKALWPRDAGHTHIEVNELSNIDLNGCGVNNHIGLTIDVTDPKGDPAGKKVLLSTVMLALATGAKLKLCSYACNTRTKYYSELTMINSLQR